MESIPNYCQNNIIDRNNIVASYAGLYIYYNNNAGTTRMSCSNNIVNLNGPYIYSTNYGLYALYNVNGDFKHNTIYQHSHCIRVMFHMLDMVQDVYLKIISSTQIMGQCMLFIVHG